MRLIICLGLLHAGLMLAVYFLAAQHSIYISVVLLVSLIGSFVLLKKQYKRQKIILQSIEHGLQSLCDNDFSVSLRQQKHGGYNGLIEAFNQTSEKLRQERQRLYQREMMLDKVLNASPMVTILVDHRDTVIFTNNSAQQAFELNDSIVGCQWSALVESLAPEFQHALHHQGESIFTLTDRQGTQQAWHVTSSNVTIHQAAHRLFLLKTITQELSKQEVVLWKK
ncbi:hypothetical protein RS130_06000 [Paraglaciecola aquimarina]|uniref:PAS domain-containing protein n=1 Tax=Paraglaciecola aquimarina TaxID=1235557 RepID=A0ABU3SU88_9ALTE|nr:hypothetical protein [Paraglaciecola aquimarina]MDU0353542.1 hypothetical protein [Paraglaciecola aquimarina]